MMFVMARQSHVMLRRKRVRIWTVPLSKKNKTLPRPEDHHIIYPFINNHDDRTHHAFMHSEKKTKKKHAEHIKQTRKMNNNWY